MEKNKEILNELKAISPLLVEISRENIQSVPAGYFDILEKRISIYSLLNQEETRNAFKKEGAAGIPDAYFENLPDSILSKVKEREEKEVEEEYPLLNSLKNIHVFQVPEGYFDNLSDDIRSNIQPKEKAKVISITGRVWWKYMAAALIAGIMLVGALFFFNLGSNRVSPYLAAAKQYQTSSQITEGIASLKAEDIISYLESHGNIIDNDVILNNIDTDGLPTEFDYLIDDNALNNYLDKININN
ncbi:MAG: hypothetical protein ABIW47_15425 [Ginsengibacter sp.]|jgi:hypothetical protein